MIDQVKDLKDTFESIRSQIERGKEPIEDLVKMKNFLITLAEDPTFLHERVDKDFRRFFYSDLTSGLFKRFTRERSRNTEYLDVLAAIFENIMLVFVNELKSGYFNHDFFDSMRSLFEYDTILYSYNYQIPEEELKKLGSSNQQWRKDLAVGDLLDAMIDENNRCSGWSQARITQIIDDMLHIEFYFDTKNTDKYIDRWSVELAQYETKTKELFEWKANLKVGSPCDVHDKSTWNKSQILEIKEQYIAEDRTVLLAFIGYRIYQENGTKSDERGKYEGWSSRFDEWISLYSPRIQPIFSKTQKGLQEDAADVDESIDDFVQPENGMERVYAVPRIRKCTSTLFIHLINLFGNLKGYDIILDKIGNSDISGESGGEQFDLTIMADLMQCVSTPCIVYHKNFIKENGPRFVELAKKRLREAPEKSLRDVRREKIESIIKSIDILQRRLLPKEERERETEILKLEVSLICLKSGFLERRIQGIRDLNQIIRNNRMMSNQSFTTKFLIEWLYQNNVFTILFDPKKTHLQIVQRCNDILRLLLADDMLNQDILEMFWSLAKSDYKFEIYKIITDVGFYLKQQHMEYLFKQIKQIPADKMGLEEFQCLSELGKYSKTLEFKNQVSQYFWEIICNSEIYKDELVNNSITKFSEMVKQQSINDKIKLFQDLTENLASNKSSIPSLKLFRNLIKDEKEDEQFNQYINSSPSKFDQNEQQSDQSVEPAQTNVDKALATLIKQENLVTKVLENLKHYCRQANEYNQQHSINTQLLNDSPRKKMFMVSSKYSHQEEIDQRLQFVQYLATICSSFSISKVELGVIYDLLVSDSAIASDQQEFLLWCKSSCEQSTTANQILDLNEVGQFFTEKMQSKELDLENLPQVGFEFLQHYFLSVNEKESNLIKQQQKTQAINKKMTGMSNQYGGSSSYGPQVPKSFTLKPAQAQSMDSEDKVPVFKLVKLPSELIQLDIVWNIALQCENALVVPKAIDFLIKVYTQLDEDLAEQKIKILDQLTDQCMGILRSSRDERTIKRVIEIIKNIIYEAEKKGTGDIQPHGALLKGELLEKITINNKASPQRTTISMSIYSNSTVWQFKKEVSKQLDLAPKYLKLELARGEGRAIKDIENGMTLGELGVKSNEIITAYKVYIHEEVADAPLRGPDGKLSEKTNQIFNEWFDMYSDEQGSMTKETCALFIKGCTGEHPSVNDERIQSMFKAYDVNNDGKIERQEFLQFYELAAKNKPETVRENLKAHNIRNDLKKLSEIQDEITYSNQDMPRYKISTNQDYFELLVSLLDRHDSASEASWILIQMLSTNQELYKRVLRLRSVADPSTGEINWASFFDSNNVYKLLYTLQIIEAVMEEGEGEDLERIVIVDDNSQANKKKIPQPPSVLAGASVQQPQQEQNQKSQETQEIEKTDFNQNADQVQSFSKLEKRRSVLVINEMEDKKLKSEWTLMFLEQKGFDYILKVLMEKSISSYKEQDFSQTFELKHVAFLLKLIRIFLMAAFSTSSEQNVYSDASLVRRSSSISDEQQLENNLEQNNIITEGSRFKELQNQLQGDLGESLIKNINYSALQAKILQIIAQVLEKEQLMFEDKLIIENALSLWVGCILHKTQLIDDFYNFRGEDGSTIRNCDDLILKGVLICSQEKVREEFKQSLGLLAKKLLDNSQMTQMPLIYLLTLLSEEFQQITKYPCKQYFELFCQLIDNYFMAKSIQSEEPSLQQKSFNPEQLLRLIIDKIKEYNASQTHLKDADETAAQTDNNSEQENIYIGLIQLTGKIIDNFDISFSEKIVQDKALIDEIFVKFLFASVFNQEIASNIENLKIHPKKGMKQQNGKQQYGKRSKDAAYKLLNSLIRKSPVLMNAFLEKSLVPLIMQIKRHDLWNYSPPGASESSQKYVGLRNPGCICYLNSMLQQFFMIPPFRYNMLSVDDKLPEDLVEYKGLKIDDNVLHQLQKLMAHLELSERQDFSPIEFCFAFKDLDGNPTNTGEQKDAQEFLNLAFDRIENLLRDTSRKYLLQSVFGGQTCSQLLCQECGKVKNRIEDYYNLSVTVKDIKSLHDSLQKLIEGEVISDYECDGCKKKVDISKRTLISSTPNVLIVHLQRIIFNFDTFQNSKINTFFEFPYLLDLQPYSFYEVMKNEKRTQKKKDAEDGEEGEDLKEDEDSQWPAEEDCFEYKLVGVNVHSGTANAGHYWSYINTKRGLDEPDENDPVWQQTETDPWLEFNDSIVREFNFDKLKDDCYGGDGKTGGNSDDNWGFGGTTYGKSAYMLIYERRKKRPLKILVPHDQVQEAKNAKDENSQDKVQYDAKKDEYYKLIDYKDSVSDIAPNQIYKQVFEDNTKFGFENSIYSQEFFDFIKSTLTAVTSLDQTANQRQQESIMTQVRKNALVVGKKTVLDILAKCYYNQGLKQMVESLIEILKKDDNLCKSFIQESLQADNCNYLMEILLECTDLTSRVNVSLLVKFVLNRLKIIEKDYLYETETVDFEYKDEKTGEVSTASKTQPVALSSRFILKGLALLNTYVAKNWSRFENYLDVLYSFAVGNSGNEIANPGAEEKLRNEEQMEIGLEFFFRHNFIEKACDFVLGRKSPLLAPGEKRQEMGGSFSRPNFSPIIMLITKMITNEKLLAKYPLDEQEKKMLLHQDLLNVMLGSSQGSKQFGHCLANMCKDNEKLSKKVSKVFIKIINNSVYDNVSNYLQALKPFLKLEDSLKQRKLEWVLGFSQIIARKGYREERYKYGLELVDKINDEAHTYVSPLILGPVEDALLSQLLKCKGKIDIFAVNCLKEMISLMAKDEQIARFVYKSAPATYQAAHYSDWIRPYLEHQRSEIERNNYYNQYRNKHEIVIKSLKLLELYEDKCQQFKQEEIAQLEQAKVNGSHQHLANDWLAFQCEEVIQHFPPQLIIGKQVAEDNEFLVYDEDPNVKVVIYEVTNEYAFSNPTGLFNLSLPHVELRTSNYQTVSYEQYKRYQAEQLREQSQIPAKQVQANQSTEADEGAAEVQSFDVSSEGANPQEQTQAQTQDDHSPELETLQLSTRSWFEHLKTGAVILKVCVTNKLKQKLSACVSFKDSTTSNVILPISFFKDTFIEADTKCIGHLLKINPAEPWGHLNVSVSTNIKNQQNHTPQITTSNFSRNISYTICMGCKKQNEVGQMFCDACGDSLEDYNDQYDQQYNGVV